MYSILKHLISNAVKYRSPEDDPQIHVIFSENQDATIIEVVDNGIGIHADNLDKIFQKGFRVSKSVEGYGLGLFFIKRCLSRCNGTIAVESDLNVGSKFTITIQR